MTNPPSDSSSTLAEAEVEEHEAILEDLSDGDTDSDDSKKGGERSLQQRQQRGTTRNQVN